MKYLKILGTIALLFAIYELTFGTNPRGTTMIGINTVPKDQRHIYEPINDKTIYKLPNGDYAIDENYRGYKMYIDLLGIVEYKRIEK